MRHTQNLYESDYFDKKSADELFNDSDTAVRIDSRDYAHSIGGYCLTIKFTSSKANVEQLFRRLNTYFENDENILYYNQESFEYNAFSTRVDKCPLWRIVLKKCASIQILDLCWHLYTISNKFGLLMHIVIEEDDFKSESSPFMAAEPSDDNKNGKLREKAISSFGNLLLYLKDDGFVDYTKEHDEFMSSFVNEIIQMAHTPGKKTYDDPEFTKCFPFISGNYFNHEFEKSFRSVMKRTANLWEATVTFSFIPEKQKGSNDSFKKQLKIICRSKIDYLFKMNLIDIVIEKLQDSAKSFEYYIDSSIRMEDCVNPYIKNNYKNETLDNLMEMLSWHSKEHIKPNNEYYFIPMSDTKLAFKNNVNKTFNRLSEFTKATDIEYIYNVI